MAFRRLNSYVKRKNDVQMNSYSYVQMSVNKSLPISGFFFFYQKCALAATSLIIKLSNC